MKWNGGQKHTNNTCPFRAGVDANRTLGARQDPDTNPEIRLQAEQGDAFAQLSLGVRYAFGLGVPQDDAEAVKWYRLSADQGNASAQSSLGFRYAFGQADQGDAAAQYILGSGTPTAWASRRTMPKP